MLFLKLAKNIFKGRIWVPKIEHILKSEESNKIIFALTETQEAEKIDRNWSVSFEKAFSVGKEEFFYIYFFNNTSSKPERRFFARKRVKDKIEQEFNSTP